MRSTNVDCAVCFFLGLVVLRLENIRPQSEMSDLVIYKITKKHSYFGMCYMRPPTVNYLQYIATGSTFMAFGLFKLRAPQSGTLSRISLGTRSSVQTVSDVCLKRICLIDTSAFSALEVRDDNRAI